MNACYVPSLQSILSQIYSVCMLSCLVIWLFATPQTVAYQAPLSIEFFRQEYWSRLPFPTRGESSQSRDQNHISCISSIDRQILYHCATWEAPNILYHPQTTSLRKVILFFLFNKWRHLDAEITCTSFIVTLINLITACSISVFQLDYKFHESDCFSLFATISLV